MKWLFIVFNLLVTLFIGFFADNEVSVKIDAPSVVTAGDEIRIRITLQKGNIQSFSRLVQDLPAGLRATPLNSANADFTFKDNRVRYIWLKMPDSDTINIEYTLKVDARLKGTFDLSSKFSYIENNERISIEGDPVNIQILPNPTIDSNLIVDIKDFKEKVIPEITPISDIPVACVRQLPFKSAGDNSYIVNILVYKESAQKFAKIEENIPSGYTAINIDSKEGIFVFKNNQAKFLWMNLPPSPYFVVSYRLVPNANVTTPPQMKGQFSYVVDEKTIVKDIIEKDMALASLSAEEIKRLIEEIRDMRIKIPIKELVAQQVTESNVSQEKTKTITQPEHSKPITQKRKPELKTSNIYDIDKMYLLEPQEGVYYRVQIAAGHRPIDVRKYFRRFRITDEVKTEFHEGWRKYSIGNFIEYKEARDYRVHIWNTTPIADAFVAAYNNGQRITVQEALMITNQKWYR